MADDRERIKGPAEGLRRVSPGEAKSLLDLGYSYVDVRSAAEFQALHPTGALNVPVIAPSVRGAASSSAEFLTVMERLFARDAKIVVGCATGARSLLAAELLLAAGFTDVIDQRAGIEGARSAFGSLLEPGWAEAGLPVSSGPDAGSFAAVKDRAAASTKSSV